MSRYRIIQLNKGCDYRRAVSGKPERVRRRIIQLNKDCDGKP